MQKLSIGRLPDCDIVIADPSVSKMHAELIIDNNNISVRDLGSTNGTYINGIRLNSLQTLISADTLKVANSIVLWQNYISIINSNSNSVIPETMQQTIPVVQLETHQSQSNNTYEDKIMCPKCGSSQIHIDTKGVSGIKACCGGAICGPLGLLFGLSGSKKVRRTCLKCNNSWY